MIEKTQAQGRHVLVTGGAGYLGSILVPALLDLGFEVSVVDCCYFGRDALAPVMAHPHLRFYEDDINRADLLPTLLKDVDAVVHLAGISNDPSSDLDPNLTIGTNYLATRALAKRARAEGVQHFVFASSCSVYGASSTRLLDEQSHTGPVTLYALTKLASERELLELSSNDFRVTSLRFATLFGLSRRMRFDLAVNTMTKRALQGHRIVVNGSGAQYRPFVHVYDAAQAIILVLRAEAERVRGQIFNVGGDRLNYTIRELADEVSNAFPGLGIEQRVSEEDIRSYRVRFRKIREALDFVPQRTVLDAVEEIGEAVRFDRLTELEGEQYYNLKVMSRICGLPVVGPYRVPSGSAEAERPKLKSAAP
ncbi:MAG: SDR family oxidoreductase [Planctomycetes bacterium]|nr:SDR family oxidoreductase [Planctomycetota bacterium]